MVHQHEITFVAILEFGYQQSLFATQAAQFVGEAAKGGTPRGHIGGETHLLHLGTEEYPGEILHHAVHLLYEVIDVGALPVLVDGRIVEVPLSAERRPVGEVLDALGTKGQVAEYLQTQVGQGGHGIRTMGRGQCKTPEGPPHAFGLLMDNLQILVEATAQLYRAARCPDRIIIKGEQAGIDYLDVLLHIVAIVLGADVGHIGIVREQIAIYQLDGVIPPYGGTRLPVGLHASHVGFVTDEIAAHQRLAAQVADGGLRVRPYLATRGQEAHARAFHGRERTAHLGERREVGEGDVETSLGQLAISLGGLLLIGQDAEPCQDGELVARRVGIRESGTRGGFHTQEQHDGCHAPQNVYLLHNVLFVVFRFSKMERGIYGFICCWNCRGVMPQKRRKN